jgi:hypothetical protein
MAKPDTFTAIYVPVWSFTADALTRYDGSRGQDRTEWRTVSSTDSQGQTQTHQEAHTVTDWHHVSGHVDQHFADVVVPASATITPDEGKALQPFDLGHAMPYQPEYLLGCASEEYSVSLPEGWTRARDAVDKDIVHGVEEDIGGDHQRIRDRSTDWSSILFLHLLLPVWVAAYVFRGKSYRVLVNGRTGEVVARRPYSYLKIAVAVLAAVVIVAALVVVIRAQR